MWSACLKGVNLIKGLGASRVPFAQARPLCAAILPRRHTARCASPSCAAKVVSENQDDIVRGRTFLKWVFWIWSATKCSSGCFDLRPHIIFEQASCRKWRSTGSVWAILSLRHDPMSEFEYVMQTKAVVAQSMATGPQVHATRPAEIRGSPSIRGAATPPIRSTQPRCWGSQNSRR
jgi:hypothetical protein